MSHDNLSILHVEAKVEEIVDSCLPGCLVGGVLADPAAFLPNIMWI